MSRQRINVDTKKHSTQAIRFIEILLNEGIAILSRHGETADNAYKLSRKFVVDVHQQLTGALMYFGKNSLFDTQMRHLGIKEDFHNGTTIEQLAFKYNLSSRQIYTIVHHKKNLAPDKAVTTGAPAMAILATRMFMKAGLEQDNAVSAARGLLVVVSAKMGGTAPYITNPRFVEGIIKQIEIARYHQAGKSIGSLAAHFQLTAEEISAIVKNHPAATMPDASELPKIKTRLFNITTSFSGFDEVNTLLEEATERISRAEEVIKKLEGGISYS
jgi:Mor family transcriptional regulator